MLGKESAACRKLLGEPVHRYACPDRVAIRLRPTQTQRDRRSPFRALVAHGASLRGEPALQDEIRTPVVIEVSNRESPAVAHEIEPRNSGRVHITTLLPLIEHIRLVSVPIKILAKELANPVPGVFILGRCGSSQW